MSSYLRRVQRRIEAKINNSDPERPRYRITQRVRGLTHRQAQRGITESPKGAE